MPLAALALALLATARDDHLRPAERRKGGCDEFHAEVKPAERCCLEMISGGRMGTGIHAIWVVEGPSGLRAEFAQLDFAELLRRYDPRKPQERPAPPWKLACSAAVSAPTIARVEALWRAAVAAARPDNPRRMGFDGETFTFGLRDGGAWRSASTWSPAAGSRARALVDVGYGLQRMACSGPASAVREAELARAAAALAWPGARAGPPGRGR